MNNDVSDTQENYIISVREYTFSLEVPCTVFRGSLVVTKSPIAGLVNMGAL